MKQAARTAKACNESSIFIASRVVTGVPSIDCAMVLMSTAPSVWTTLFCPARVWVGRPPLHRLFQDARPVELVFRTVQHHRIGVDRRRILADREIAGEGAVFMIREMERRLVDLAEALLLENLP